MKLLIDTCAFLWFVSGDTKLSHRARAAMERKEAELILSAASIWELAIKSSLGRLILPCPLDEYIAEKIKSGFHILPLSWQHAAAVEAMPFHHRDPFDRLLAAQALAEKMPLVSSDAIFRRYKVDMIW
ncbi:MAG TPA: PIN domain nuclease [Verrucomicrobia bacterium]|nr:MAG: twitching motility protein PilT [Lentisphaerae bacterium GWF2_57_35]HBA83729.1 PIN domain nuclease [Verrucomicrobiota bacterium]